MHVLAQSAFKDVRGWLSDLWQLSLGTAQDSGVTLGQLLTALVLLFAGWLLARWLSRVFQRRVLGPIGLHVSAQDTLRSVVFYALLVVLTLFVLRLLNVPVTVFTVIGGALAIGVGFGSQSIVNNLSSGDVVDPEPDRGLRPARKLPHGGPRGPGRRHRLGGLPHLDSLALRCRLLVDALLHSGRLDEGEAILDRLLGLSNDLGLFAEQAHRGTGEALGNLPQAFSHMARVTTCTHLDAARAGELPREEACGDVAFALDRLRLPRGAGASGGAGAGS